VSSLSDAQFHQFKRTTYRIEPGQFSRTVHAYNDKTGQQVGYLGWDGTGDHVPEAQRNAISNVEVHKSHRGRGVATELLRYAQGVNPEIRHSRVQTEEGKAWNESLKRRGVE
jgi:GNAT superfamily N-acetyltransferase